LPKRPKLRDSLDTYLNRLLGLFTEGTALSGLSEAEFGAVLTSSPEVRNTSLLFRRISPAQISTQLLVETPPPPLLFPLSLRERAG